MDPMSDQRPAIEDRLRSHLRGSTTTATLPDLGDVRRRGRRRQRAARVAGSLAVVTLLVGAGAVVATFVGGGGGDELLVGGPVEPTVRDPGDDASAAVTTIPVVPPLLPTTGPAGVAVPSFVTGSHVVAWGDGFVSLDVESVAQPIGELSPEILELFSDDVRSLFPEPPDTIEEAIRVLSEHPDLLAEVERVLADHPEALDAIYGAPAAAVLRLAVSSDGLEWSALGDLSMPDGMEWVHAAAAHEGRLLVVGGGSVRDSGTDPIEPFEEQIVVAVTTDLAAWASIAVLDTDASVELPRGFSTGSWVSGVAFGSSGAVVSVRTSAHFDAESVLPAEFRRRLVGAYGMSYDRDGITIEIGGEGEVEWPDSGSPRTTQVGREPSETHRFTWDELGVDGAFVEEPWSRTDVWAGDPIRGLTHADLGATATSDVVVTAPRSGGFVAATNDLDPTVWTSADGATWTDRNVGLGADAWISGLTSGPSGAVLIATSGATTTAWRSTPDLVDWTPSPVPTSEDGTVAWVSHMTGGSRGVAVVASISPSGPGLPDGDMVLERDGHRLVLSSRSGSISIRVTGPGPDGPDSLIVEWSMDETPPEDRVDLSDPDRLSVIDPVTGDVVVSFDASDADAAFAEAFPELDQAVEEGSARFELTFSVDGERWTVLDRFVGDGDPYPIAVVLNGQRLLLVLETYELDGTPRREYRVYDV